MSATIKLEKKHIPVLLEELISIISPLYGGTFIDCTFGAGGYSKKILEDKNNIVIGLDRDKNAFYYADKIKKKFGNRFHFENITFNEINKLNLNNKNLKGVIFDLGVSTDQINDPSKGISFYSKGKLNMKMGLNSFSADDIINNNTERNLYEIFKFFGDEKYSKKIAKRIILERKKKIIQTQDLVNIIESIKPKKNLKIHKSTKIFQSLRIVVNQEISQLVNGLINSFKILPIGGIMVVVTFHSLEDRIVKFFFKNYSEKKNLSRYLPQEISENILLNLVKKKPVLPSEKEKKINPSSRSAKLRYAFKIKHNENFNQFLNKFENFLVIERNSLKL